MHYEVLTVPGKQRGPAPPRPGHSAFSRGLSATRQADGLTDAGNPPRAEAGDPTLRSPGRPLGFRDISPGSSQAALSNPAEITLPLARARARPGCGRRLRDVGEALQTAPSLAQLGEARAGEAGGAHAQVRGAARGTRAGGGALRRAAGT